MSSQKDMSTPCVVRESALRYARRAGLIDIAEEDLEECKVVDSVRQLMALGLSMQEIEDLDIRQPMLQAISEYARLDLSGRDQSERAADAIEAAMGVVKDEIQKLDMELEMLTMRKRALKRRTQILQKVTRSLQAGDGDAKAA